MMFCIPPGRLDTIPHERAVWERRGRREEGAEEREEGGGRREEESMEEEGQVVKE